MECSIYEIGALEEYRFVVIFARYAGKWIFCKHKERETWETAGGHVEAGETLMEAAKRELYEETGSIGYTIVPICDYRACDETWEDKENSCANGRAFLAEVNEVGELPESEMECIRFFDTLPEALTYPDIVRVLYPYVLAKV